MKHAMIGWLGLGLAFTAQAADWPQWRYDAQRSAVSAEKLPDKLNLQWVQKYPKLTPAHWQIRQWRQQFDLGYEPVVAGKTMFIASSLNDLMTAIDVDSGAEKWRFHADGPVRFAPSVWQDKVFFGSDDGCLYCLDAASGKLLWKRCAAPSQRRMLGNGRLISVWPVRGGPVVHEGRVYFAAGVWPFEGIFVSALDAATGNVVWVNSSTGNLYLEHPHRAMAFGGPSPQGYLLIHKDTLAVPSGRAFPAFFDLTTGELREFEFGYTGNGNRPGGWFLASTPDGELAVDPDISIDIHADGPRFIGRDKKQPRGGTKVDPEVSIGSHVYKVMRGMHQVISLAGRQLDVASKPPEVKGTVHRMLAADGKLFVVTREGGVYCFGAQQVQPKTWEIERRTLGRTDDQASTTAQRILKTTNAKNGYCLVLGLKEGRLVEEIIRQSELYVIAIDPDAKKVDVLRKRLDAAGLYGARASVHVGDPGQFGLPPYLARLIVSENLSDEDAVKEFIAVASNCLQPYGGTAFLPVGIDRRAMARHRAALRTGGITTSRTGNSLRLVRTGALPRAADYRGEKNLDGLVRAPLGILWFGDTFHHHKQFMPRVEGGQASGLPIVVDGVMRYGLAKEAFEPTVVAPSDSWHKWMAANKNAHREALTDVYTGRMLTTAEVAARSASRRPRKDRKGLKEPPDKRVNPLTGVRELRNIVVTYAGCGKGIDYGYIYTTRSGTGAFYDKRIESGTINISGTRSGCRNAIIAAGGVLLLPHWGSGCTCNYPNTTSLALASMPESHEQWAEWGPVQAEAPIRRGGINFGAPGDRMGRDGTLWIEFPSVAGVSPNIPVAIEPAAAKPFHRHALWIEGGEGQPWVVASGIEGARLVRITPIAKLSPPTPGVYSVRWEGSVQAKFSEEHTFHVKADRDMRLWARSKMILNGALLRRYGKRVDASDKVAMKAGRKYKIRMDYYGPHHGFGSGPGQVELAWASPSTPRQVVPAKRLFTKRGKRGGLTATYHYNKELYGVRIIQVDPKVQFDWSKTYPAAFDGSDKAIKPLLSYTVRLYFAEPKEMQAGQRVFTVALQRNVVLPDFDIAAEAGGHLRGVVKEFKGIAVEKDLVITLTPKAGKTLISGVELIAEKQQSKRLRNRP